MTRSSGMPTCLGGGHAALALSVLLSVACQAANSAPRAEHPQVPAAKPPRVQARESGQMKRRAPSTSAGSQRHPPPVILVGAPQPARAPDPELQALLDRCGPGELSLHRAAQKLLERDFVEHPLDTSALTAAVRTSGGPFTKPRGLRLRQASGDVHWEPELASWLDTLPTSPERRCGIAADDDSVRGHQLAVIAAEAYADLAALPTQVEVGYQVHFQARLLVPSTHAELIVLGPDGSPQRLEPVVSGDAVSARFYLDTPGLHQIQLMHDAAGGPRVALEAWVGVGQPLPRTLEGPAAPGEEVTSELPPRESLLGMLNRARATRALTPLKRDARLERLASRHARAMRLEGRLSHDLGDGNPVWRLQAAQIAAQTAGENLAHAPTLGRAHRAIWASPSHRANVLDPHFDSVGIGAVQSDDGSWWVCELMADLR